MDDEEGVCPAAGACVTMTTDATHQHPRFNSGEFYPVLQGGANRFYIFRWTKSNPMVMILGAGSAGMLCKDFTVERMYPWQSRLF